LAAVVSRLEKEIDKGRFSWKRVLGLGKNKRSRCDQCHQALVWKENIPVLSFLFLKGQCRSCHSPIPAWYPLTELGAGVVFVFTFFFWQARQEGVVFLVLYLLISLLLFFVFVFDWRTQVIPDEATIGLFFLALVLKLISPNSALNGIIINVVIGLVAAGFLYLLHLLTKGKGMGLGDVKLAFFIGFFLGGWGVVVAFYLAFLTGGLLGVIMILTRRAKFKQKIAFGPFLIVGTFVSWWYQAGIVEIVGQWLSL